MREGRSDVKVKGARAGSAAEIRMQRPRTVRGGPRCLAFAAYGGDSQGVASDVDAAGVVRRVGGSSLTLPREQSLAVSRCPGELAVDIRVDRLDPVALCHAGPLLARRGRRAADLELSAQHHPAAGAVGGADELEEELYHLTSHLFDRLPHAAERRGGGLRPRGVVGSG